MGEGWNLGADPFSGARTDEVEFRRENVPAARFQEFARAIRDCERSGFAERTPEPLRSYHFLFLLFTVGAAVLNAAALFF